MAAKSSPRILLADDSPVERTGLAHFLQRAGYHVEECEDGRVAIEQIRAGTVDLLLLDLQMPEVDGFEVLNYVKAHHSSLPVILLSGMPTDVIQLRMHGLAERELPPLFLKPVDLEQLLAVMEMSLRGTLPRPESASTAGQTSPRSAGR
jgi:DNA-binding response OmpR family regulator